MTDASHNVEDHLATLDEVTLQDSKTLMAVMHNISGATPALWNVGTIGYDTYHYKYDSGREGDSFIIGFYPRNGKLTIYLMDGTARYSELLAQLGKYTTTGYCINIKRLADIELPVLEQILQQSFDYIKALAKDGPINRILWQK